MSPLEDEIRGALRSEAARLRAVPPLWLPPADGHEATITSRTPAARWLLSWRGPAVAVLAMLLVAVTLVTLKSVGSGHTVPAASPSAIVSPAGTPRYYLAPDATYLDGTVGRSAITVDDDQTGSTLDTIPLPAGNVLSGELSSGAADDRTFVWTGAVGHTLSSAPPVIGPTMWYLLQVVPDSTSPVQVSKLAIKGPPGGVAVAIALSGDGSELAVAYITSNPPVREPFKDEPKQASRLVTVSIYSVATGRLRHSWSGTISASFNDPGLITDLSWASDNVLGFAVTYNPGVSEEVRTLDLGAASTDLLAGSHVVWSQYVRGPRGDIYHEDTPRACDTPFLTGDGQAVACANDVYSARDKRLTAVWLAYPLATPTRAHVIASVPQPQDVSSVAPVSVDWMNTSGTAMIGSWYPTANSNTTALSGFISDGMVLPFTTVPGRRLTW
jgi:hypothetical protein